MTRSTDDALTVIDDEELALITQLGIDALLRQLRREIDERERLLRALTVQRARVSNRRRPALVSREKSLVEPM